MTVINRSIRLRSFSNVELSKTPGDNGEIRYDETNNTLRIFNGKVTGGSAILATRQYTDQAITNLIDNATSSLNTLKELADAINNDSNFYQTIGNTYVSNTSLANTLGSYVTNSALTSTLGSYVTNSALTSNYTTTTGMNAAISTAVSNLIDAAPGALDTLNELAAALNDDANFYNTITNTYVSNSSLSTTLNSYALLESPSFTGSVGIGTTATVSLDVNGAVAIRDYASQSYVNTAGNTVSGNLSSLIQNSTVFNSTGATAQQLYGQFSAPRVSHDASSGTLALTVYGQYAAPVITSTATTSRINQYGGYFNSTRASTTDLSTGINSLYGVAGVANMATTLDSTATSSGLYGGYFSASFTGGASSNVYGSYSLASLSGTGTKSTTNLIGSYNYASNSGATATQTITNIKGLYAQAWPWSGVSSTTTVTNAYGAHIQLSAAGSGTLTVTNMYGTYIQGPATNATNTITNYYGLYLSNLSGTGTVTNRYALYSADTGNSYFAGSVGIGVVPSSYALQVNGSFAATTKSFVIDHPTKPGKQLRYGSLEGPENGVYVRGKLYGNKIVLPEYWTKLVDKDSITVQLTPIGKHQNLYVTEIVDNTIIVENGNLINKSINCFYVVYGERIDVEKLEVEIG